MLTVTAKALQSVGVRMATDNGRVALQDVLDVHGPVIAWSAVQQLLPSCVSDSINVVTPATLRRAFAGKLMFHAPHQAPVECFIGERTGLTFAACDKNDNIYGWVSKVTCKSPYGSLVTFEVDTEVEPA